MSELENGTNGRTANVTGRLVRDPEVCEKATRRQFTAEYKLRVVREADQCKPGEIGALLRREGLYSSHLRTWRRQRDAGSLKGLAARKRGPKSAAVTRERKEIEKLERENQDLRHRLDQAEKIIALQKKIAGLLEEVSSESESSGNSE